MGCFPSNGEKSKQKIPQTRGQNYQERISHIQKIDIKINNVNYQLVQEDYEDFIFRVQSQSIFSQNQFILTYQTFQHSMIKNDQQIKSTFRQKQQSKKENSNIIKLDLRINEQDLLIFSDNHKLRLKSLKRNKIIVQFKIGSPQINYMSFDQYNSRIIYFQEIQDDQNFICVLNVRNRQVFREPNNQPVAQIFSIPKTDEFLIYIHDYGIVLNKFNCDIMRIERIKLLSYFMPQVCIIDDYYLINLISNQFHIKFDKNYNIIQKLKINFGASKKLINLKQLEDIEEQKQFISEFSNYQIEYQHRFGRIQHIISSNSRYLAYIIENSLIFHLIQEQFDQQINFNQNIELINFSANSNYLFAILNEKIKCFKTRQKLKQYHSYHIKIKEQIAIQNGIILTINKEGYNKTLSRQSCKLIFKLKTINEYSSFDYHKKLGIIQASISSQISIFNLADRKLIIKQQLENKQCKFVGDTNQLFILTKQLQLQLWIIQKQNITFQRNIMDHIQVILQGYSNKYCMKISEQIVILDQKFIFIQSIDYQTEFAVDIMFQIQFENLIDKWDQVMQEDQILKLKYVYGVQVKKIVLQLETRNIKQIMQ